MPADFKKANDKAIKVAQHCQSFLVSSIVLPIEQVLICSTNHMPSGSQELQGNLQEQAATSHLPLLLKHAQIYDEPADETRVQLAELLQVKGANARIQLPPNEEVIQVVPCIRPTSAFLPLTIAAASHNPR